MKNNTMKYFKTTPLILLLFPLVSFGQGYSNYYGSYDYSVKADVNVNANINKNVNVTKTVTSIDYGALANANATRERNRIETLKVANERDRDAMLAIANDPSKAFDYGKDNTWVAKRKVAETYGFKKFTWYHKIPHQSLFTSTGGYNYQNISDNYITTELELNGAFRIGTIKDETVKRNLKYFEGIFKSVEEYAKGEKFIVGEYNEELKAFLHKKDINKTKVFGVDGFKQSFIYENDYEIVIKDNYFATSNGVVLWAGVRYKADKDEVTFEELEGRRYYLRRLAEKIISTSTFSDVK
jgi:hypothetical protein